MTAAVQTIWADLLAATLAGAEIACVVSPGSRSTPLVAALARTTAEVVTIIDERAAAFYALGAARATGRPVALICTSGTAAAHYLPAIVEASLAGVPLLAITANRPPELHACGASQTIDQHGLYGGFVRGAFDLGAPAPGALALRALHRKLIQAITLARGPHPGPVHVDVPLRKPLEPAAPSTDDERALAVLAARLALPKTTIDGAARGDVPKTTIDGAGGLAIAPPVLAPDRDAIDELARRVAAEPRGLIVAGALIAADAGTHGEPSRSVFELARRSGYPIVAEASSQLRLLARPDDVVFVDHFDLIADAPAPDVLVQLGAEPVAQCWPAFVQRARARWVLAGPAWHDADSTAAGVILGDTARAVADLVAAVPHVSITCGAQSATRRKVEHAAANLAWRTDWAALEERAAQAAAAAIASVPAGETALLEAVLAALPDGAILQIGNSLPIRVVDHVASRARPAAVITQRGAAGIDGLIASAAGATRTGRPVLLVLGDVSFAHDLGGLLAARALAAPLAVLVVDNSGGQIFASLPIASASLPDGTFARHWLTDPAIDPVAIAGALGHRAVAVRSSPEAAAAVTTALATHAVTVIHAPVAAAGARDVRRTAIDLQCQPPLARLGGLS